MLWRIVYEQRAQRQRPDCAAEASLFRQVYWTLKQKQRSPTHIATNFNNNLYGLRLGRTSKFWKTYSSQADDIGKVGGGGRAHRSAAVVLQLGYIPFSVISLKRARPRLFFWNPELEVCSTFLRILGKAMKSGCRWIFIQSSSFSLRTPCWDVTIATPQPNFQLGDRMVIIIFHVVTLTGLSAFEWILI